MFSSSQPRRILAVMGIFTASTMPLTRLGGPGQFGHHGRPAADAADFAHWATHVDIGGSDAEGLQIRRGVAHFFRHGAEQLDGERLVGGRSLDELEGLGLLFQQGAGVDQVGRGQADAAQLTDREAKGQVGIARQRRQEQVGCSMSAAQDASSTL